MTSYNVSHTREGKAFILPFTIAKSNRYLLSCWSIWTILQLLTN